MEDKWIPQLMKTLAIDEVSLPVIWDADFLYGPRDAAGTDTYVLCEINVSSCFAIPDEAPAAIARTVKGRIRQTQGAEEETVPQAPRPCHKHRSGGERGQCHSVAEISQSFYQTLFLLGGRAAIEVIAAEVLVHRSILEHVIDGGEHRGRDREDRLLVATASLMRKNCAWR